MAVLVFLTLAVSVYAGPTTENPFKDQFCTDPRTMKKHAAFTEWADAYSCSRHRCQPGGRGVAMYTVGCKRVEAPESATDCEEVVEDANMQFPYCCTRLRCLVKVKGEVWTQVLGQPWEVLPATPWSHMYKMKRPPPGESFLPHRSPSEGPVYKPTSDSEIDKVLRASNKGAANHPDCIEGSLRAVPAPDIVIALTTNDDKDLKTNDSKSKQKQQTGPIYEEDVAYSEVDLDDHVAREKTNDPTMGASEEKYEDGSNKKTMKLPPTSWTKVTTKDWPEHESNLQEEAIERDGALPEDAEEEKTEESPSHLQALVDAIGSRMKDIENVVQQMNEKVQQAKPNTNSTNKRIPIESDNKDRKRKKIDDHPKAKRPSPDGELYKRFSVLKRGSKYLRSSVDATTELPLMVEDKSSAGYFSDASNSILRRANSPKEPPKIYMAPVENRRKAHSPVPSDNSDDSEKKHKKHAHKKKKNKGKGHKKHKKDGKKKHRMSSTEIEKNIVSLEDSNELSM